MEGKHLWKTDIENAFLCEINRQFHQIPDIEWGNYLSISFPVGVESGTPDQDIEERITCEMSAFARKQGVKLSEIEILPCGHFTRTVVVWLIINDILCQPDGDQEERDEPLGEIPEYLSAEWHALDAERRAAMREAFDLRRKAEQTADATHKIYYYELAAKAAAQQDAAGMKCLESQLRHCKSLLGEIDKSLDRLKHEPRSLAKVSEPSQGLKNTEN